MDDAAQCLEPLLESGFDLVVWDFDGVMADTERLHAESYRLILEEKGRTTRDGFFLPFVGMTESEIWQDLARTYDIGGDWRFLRHKRGELMKKLSRDLEPNWFVRPVLSALPNSTHRIVSSGNAESIAALLSHWHLDGAFTSISAPHSTKDTAPKKSRLTALIGEAPETDRVLVIEDSKDYLRLANELGTRTLGVRHSLNSLEDSDADCMVEANASGAVDGPEAATPESRGPVAQ